jgi:hypothetical protein
LNNPLFPLCPVIRFFNPEATCPLPNGGQVCLLSVDKRGKREIMTENDLFWKKYQRERIE